MTHIYINICTYAQTHIPALKSLYVHQIYGEAALDLANREETDRESGQETYFLFPSFCPVHVCAMSLYNRSVIPSKMVNLIVFIALEETIITKQLRNEEKKPKTQRPAHRRSAHCVRGLH